MNGNWDPRCVFKVCKSLISHLLSSSSLSMFFLFWPFPGAPLTSFANWTRRIFLKSSCVRSLLPLTAAAFVFLSSAGILWSFSTWQNKTKTQESKMLSNKSGLCNLSDWAFPPSPLRPYLRLTSDEHPPILHPRHRHWGWHSPSRLMNSKINTPTINLTLTQSVWDDTGFCITQQPLLGEIIQEQLTSILLSLFVLLLHLQDLSSRDVVFSLELSVVFYLGLCWCLCGSPLDTQQVRITITRMQFDRFWEWESICEYLTLHLATARTEWCAHEVPQVVLHFQLNKLYLTCLLQSLLFLLNFMYREFTMINLMSFILIEYEYLLNKTRSQEGVWGVKLAFLWVFLLLWAQSNSPCPFCAASVDWDSWTAESVLSQTSSHLRKKKTSKK